MSHLYSLTIHMSGSPPYRTNKCVQLQVITFSSHAVPHLCIESSESHKAKDGQLKQLLLYACRVPLLQTSFPRSYDASRGMSSLTERSPTPLLCFLIVMLLINHQIVIVHLVVLALASCCRDIQYLHFIHRVDTKEADCGVSLASDCQSMHAEKSHLR